MPLHWRLRWKAERDRCEMVGCNRVEAVAEQQHLVALERHDHCFLLDREHGGVNGPPLHARSADTQALAPLLDRRG